MKGLIILEGPDCCGKTTLGRYLTKHHGAVYFHCEGKKELFPVMFDYQTQVLKKACEVSQHGLAVIDRLWPSEKVYADVFRGGSAFPHQARLMDRVIRKHAGIYVLCLPLPGSKASVDAAVRRHKAEADPDHPYKDEDYLKIIKGYKDLASTWLNCREDVFHLDIYKKDEADLKKTVGILQLILTSWRLAQYPYCLETAVPGILGHIGLATHLVVGEKVNPKDPAIRWPFYEHANCSEYLCKCLDMACIRDQKLMFINALDEGSEFHLNKLTCRPGQYPPLKVVSLGNKADRLLTRLGIYHAKVPHPQFARRFHFYNHNQYASLLHEALA